MGDVMITIKIVGQLGTEEDIPSFMTIEKAEVENVDNVILKIHEKYSIPRKKFSKNLNMDTSPFTGLLVSKNEELLGMFTVEGYEPRTGTNQSVENGDQIFFVLPAAGG